MPTTSNQLEPHACEQKSASHSASPVLLCATGLCKAYGGLSVLDGISLELREGECIALVGPNGSGKTTLENILSGSLEPDAGTIRLFTNGSSETFRFPRSFWQNLNPFDHFTPERLSWEGVSKTWQEVRLFSSQTLLHNIAVAAPKQLGENPWTALVRRRASALQEHDNQQSSRDMLVRLQLGDRADSTGDRISLGQSKRVAIGRALRTGARILFLDEPLAGLDSSGIREIISLLKELLHDNRITLVISEHAFNLPHVLGLATKVWSLQEGKLQEETKDAFVARTKGGTGERIEKLLRTIAPSATEIAREQLPSGAVLTRLAPQKADTTPILEIQDLVVYRGKRLVIGEPTPSGHIQGFSLTLRRGETAFIQAPNGWGKTTLLEAVAGLHPISRGVIRFMGRQIQELEPWQRAQMGMSLLQSRQNGFPRLTVRESLRLSGVSNAPPSLRSLLGRHVANLSGGERQRLALACLFYSGQRAIALLDEPFACLDQQTLQDQEWWSALAQNSANLIAIPHATE